MRITEVSFPKIEWKEQATSSTHSIQNYSSSIRFGKSSQFFLWKWLVKLYNQILSWFQSEEEKKPEKFIKIHKNDEQIQYRLEDSESEILISSRNARLEQISFDKEELRELPKMIKKVMKKEKIDMLQTENLHHAWQLWKGGLKTESLLPFSIGKNDSLSGWVAEILKEAAQKREDQTLSSRGKKALQLIERSIMHSIAVDSTELRQTNDEDLIPYSEFNLGRARRRLYYLENTLGFSFAINELIEAEEASSFRSCLEDIQQAGKISMCRNIYPRDYVISLGAFFKLAKELEREVEHGKGPNVATFKFKRK